MRESDIIAAIKRTQKRLHELTTQAAIMDGQPMSVVETLDREHAKLLAIVVEELGFNPSAILDHLDKPTILVP